MNTAEFRFSPEGAEDIVIPIAEPAVDQIAAYIAHGRASGYSDITVLAIILAVGMGNGRRKELSRAFGMGCKSPGVARK